MRSNLPAKLLAPVTAVALLVALIELLAWQYGLPHITSILAAVGKLWAAGTLSHDILVSSTRWLIGWSVGAIVGIALGVLTGRVRAAKTLLEGLIVLLRAVPFISLVPLSIRIFGLSEIGKFLLVAWARVRSEPGAASRRQARERLARPPTGRNFATVGQNGEPSVLPGSAHRVNEQVRLGLRRTWLAPRAQPSS